MPFHLKNLENNLIIKIQHYRLDNSEGKLYTDLVPMDFNVWRLIKSMKEKFLKEVDGDVPSKNYLCSFIDKDSKNILRIINPSEGLKELVS